MAYCFIQWFLFRKYSLPTHRSKIIKEEYSGGFTLIELMLIVAILGALAGIAIPVYNAQIKKARIFKTISDIQIIGKEIDIYKTDMEALPNSLEDIGREDFVDSWGNPYQYINHNLLPKNAKGTPKGSRKNKNDHPINLDYDLFSMGPDGIFKLPLTAKASYDDIIRADEGRYIGPVYEF